MLGLGHGGRYNGEVNSATQQFSTSDTRLWLTISYIAPSNPRGVCAAGYPVMRTNWRGVQASETPLTLDIMAIQQLQGAGCWKVYGCRSAVGGRRAGSVPRSGRPGRFDGSDRCGTGWCHTIRAVSLRPGAGRIRQRAAWGQFTLGDGEGRQRNPSRGLSRQLTEVADRPPRQSSQPALQRCQSRSFCPNNSRFTAHSIFLSNSCCGNLFITIRKWSIACHRRISLISSIP